MPRNIEIGKMGEDMACKYLINKGYRILKRNYRDRIDEIDIIARSPDGTLIFCEVKALVMGDISDGLMPEDHLTPGKLKKIRRSAQFFAAQHPGALNNRRGWRIDLVAIAMYETKNSIRHYENL